MTADAINPPHYTSSSARCECGKTIECIQVTEGMGFCLGNAVKYAWRAGLKNDNSKLQDLRKMLWYVQRAIEMEERSAAQTKAVS